VLRTGTLLGWGLGKEPVSLGRPHCCVCINQLVPKSTEALKDDWSHAQDYRALRGVMCKRLPARNVAQELANASEAMARGQKQVPV
jgi:hypothetical protein